jgi:hypothetical protein
MRDIRSGPAQTTVMKYSPLPLSRTHVRTKTIAKQALLSADPIVNHRFFIEFPQCNALGL